MTEDEKKELTDSSSKANSSHKEDERVSFSDLTTLGESLVSAYNSIDIEPLFSVASALNDSIKSIGAFSSSLMSMTKHFADEISYISESTSQMMQGLASIGMEIVSPFRRFLQVVVDPLRDLIDSINDKSLAENGKKLEIIVTNETLEAEWFPHFLLFPDLEVNVEMMEKILFAIQSTKKSKNRVRKIDRIVFDYYTNNRVEKIKKGWRKLDVPEHLMRIMHQAVQAYHRKEYALTVSALSPLWERIIREKANKVQLYDVDGKPIKGEKLSRQYLLCLIESNESESVFHSFYEEYVMYDCRSDDQANSNVPGRNSTSHGWYSGYPRRKAALNAIFFTDFLLHLEPLENKNAEEEGKLA